MKKIFYIFAAATMLLASCSSDDNTSIEAPNVPVQTLSKKNLKLNINIVNPEDNDLTRAFVKNGWVEGDKLNIWFDANTNEAKANPDLVIKYVGTAWEVDEKAEVSKNMPSDTGSGTMKVVYDGDVKFSTKKAYTYNTEDQSLTATLNEWQYMTEIQVVVTGISAADDSNYTLSCDHLTAFNSYNVTADGVTASVKAVDSPVDGISNADGIAFVFAASNKYGEPANYRFTLIKKDENGNIASEKYFIGTNKNIAQSTSKLIGLKLNIATFHDLANMENADDYVTIGGLQWAKMNLGATTEAGDYSTCMGDYFAWGEITPRYTSITRPTDPKNIVFGGWKTGYTGYNSGKQTFNGTILVDSCDAASQALGHGWRTPTVQEYVDLINACVSTTYSAGGQLTVTDIASANAITTGGIYYLTNYANGVPGILFVDKTNINNRLFFPIAYYITDTGLKTNSERCYYWTRNTVTSNNRTMPAYFNFTYASDQDKEQNRTKKITVGNTQNFYYGQTIRPVRTIPTSGN